jgi:hypothetical protein
MSCFGAATVCRPTEPPAGGPDVPTGPPSGLVIRAGTRPQHTLNRETDARTALTRGLADYLMGLEIELEARGLRFQNCFEQWAEPEDSANFPSAAVYALGPGVYESALTPKLDPGHKVEGAPNTYLITTAELVVDLTVEVYCTDPTERMVVSGMLEDALNPVDWRNGFMLALPHYYGVHGVYELRDAAFQDDEASATRGSWRALYTLSARVPVVRPRDLPLARHRVTAVVE